MRLRTIQTTDGGGSSDSGWSDWYSTSVGLDWISLGYASRSGSSWTKTECQIEVAAGIGRPWKVIWRNKITNLTTFVETYTADLEQLFMPGTTASYTFDATDGTSLEFGSGAALVIADGL